MLWTATSLQKNAWVPKAVSPALSDPLWGWLNPFLGGAVLLANKDLLPKVLLGIPMHSAGLRLVLLSSEQIPQISEKLDHRIIQVGKTTKTV